MSTRGVLLDRDGVINELAYFADVGLIDSPLNPDQFSLLAGVTEAIRTLNHLGFKVAVVSNQPAIAKGKMTEKLFAEIRSKMKKELEKEGAHLDAEYYCFHHPDAVKEEYKIDCECRKPKPGLLLKAKSDLGLDSSRSFSVGDSLVDIKAGKAAGFPTILIGTMKCDLCRRMEEDAQPDHIAESLIKAVEIISGSDA
ncbi:MAG TPA: HAD family hydrolase [Candidatus Acidoferrum sp.]|nr:HAD family hydrolase [Candidatus Acidoferrum sp.]